MRADESFVDGTLSWFDDQLFPLGETDDASAVVEDAAEDHAEELRPGWRNDLPVAAPSGGRRA